MRNIIQQWRWLPRKYGSRLAIYIHCIPSYGKAINTALIAVNCIAIFRMSQRWPTLPPFLPRNMYIHDLTQWASDQISKNVGCAYAGNAGNVFPRRRLQKKPLVSDPGMHHGTCVTHVPWCMSGSLTRGGRENVPGIPGACAPAISRIWQEAHEVWCHE